MLRAEPQLEAESPGSTVSQRNKALQHAKIVKEQLSQRSSKRRRVTRSGKSSEKDPEVFRFTDLPAEIRDMIYTFYFTSSNGEKPGLMWAFKINGVKVRGDFYDAAEKIYYTKNTWTFNIKDCLKNSILGNMDKYHIEMLRRMIIEIPKEIHPCTKFSDALQRAVNVEDLTLSVRSDIGIRRAIHEIIPNFKHLRRITLSIPRSGRDANTSLRRRNGTEYYKLFRPVRDIMDESLGQQGVLIQDTARLQEWLWKIDVSSGRQKAFKIACPKKHIKFE